MASLNGSTSVREVLGDVVGSMVAQRHAQESSLHVKTSGQRRFTTVQTDLEDYRTVRAMHGGTVGPELASALMTAAPIIRRRAAEERLEQTAIELARRGWRRTRRRAVER